MKGLTDIPFAKEAATLMMHPDEYVPGFDNKEFGFWARVTHFENRYKSIDPLLEELSAVNILELSSGFSFRGLALVKEKKIHYIDTDLPGVVEQKREFVTALSGSFDFKGKLEILPLNALDKNQFEETVNHFPEGEIVIVNEGLLMYLDAGEKEKLCSIIHAVLIQRGGYWITADIYTRTPQGKIPIKMNDKLQQFLDQHQVEENKFDSIEAAKDFFTKAGFVIDKEAEPDYSKLSSLKYMLQSAKPQQLESLGKAGKIHATWRLKPVDS